MFKNLKLNASITIVIALVTAIFMFVLFIVSDMNMTSAMRSTSVNNMETSMNSKIQTINEYINNSERSLLEFSKSGEILALAKEPKNPSLVSAAQKYNEAFASTGNWDALYYCTWESETITHSNTGTIGLVLREGDKLKELQDGILSANGVYNIGILKSPASGELVISMYYPIMDGDTPLGFVGGAVRAGGLKDLLDATVVKGMENATYSLINANTGVYIFDSDESLIMTEITNENLKNIITEVKDNGKESGTSEFKDEAGASIFSTYQAIPDRGWLFAVKAKSSEIFSEAYKNRLVLGILCIIAFVLISLISFIFITLNIRPLARVLKSIDKLKNLNLSPDSSISKYVGCTSEVGMIATAIDSLSKTLRDIIQTLTHCSDSLTGSSDTMTQTSRELLDSIENNATTTEELSASILSTNTSIEAVTAEIAKMNDMVNNIEEKVTAGNIKSDKLITTAEAMSDMADNTLANNTEKIAQTKVDIDEAMKNLQSLVKINEMATQILDITSQTNLLSLNASIEAARAGDAGRGFAVVAGEIGSLADSSSKTATEIQNICEEANKSIASVRECFEDIIRFMEGDVSDKFREFADIAKEYGEAVSDIRDAIQSIDESSSMFIDSVASIRSQIEIVNSASNDNEAGVDDIINKNSATTTTADSIISIANENQNNANDIKNIINKFK